MFYTVYKTTNSINGRFYIGKHKTKNIDDGYLGSGFLLKKAIEKYGIGAFKKEILKICETEQEMNFVEKELVVISKESYNLKFGGEGGFDYINTYRPNEENRVAKIKYFHTGRIQRPGQNLNGSKAGADKIRGKTYEETLGKEKALAHKLINSEYMKSNNPNKIKVECPHCRKIGSKPPMVRFHFDFCKFKVD